MKLMFFFLRPTVRLNWRVIEDIWNHLKCIVLASNVLKFCVTVCINIYTVLTLKVKLKNFTSCR